MEDTNIRKEESRKPVTVEEIQVSKFQKEGTKTAMIRQEVTVKSFYPSQVHSSDMQQNFVAKDQFDDTEQEFEAIQNRTAFVEVPEAFTVEEAQALIPENACLYRVLSNAPILTENHKNAIERGLTDLDTIGNSQVARYGEGDEKEGQIIPDDKGRVQYRKVFYWNSEKADEDRRGMEAHPEHITAEIAEELALQVSADTDGVVLDNQVPDA